MAVANQEIAKLRSHAMAQLITAVPQEPHSSFGLRANNTVAMARTPRHGSFSSDTPRGQEIIYAALCDHLYIPDSGEVAAHGYPAEF
ncbi:hypothetical protein [Corynebacterium anserum]|uniref:Uncharacterized protein n=1 Tax=Corynebacterium anserum TaxID=2684406 RepID=A0A7G7YNL8_9CORY|nr:hypothetical protein [Corynebacterium anserum]QNH96088.1 hypothetical protein GP473_04905 [Corynebacterium anserum]